MDPGTVEPGTQTPIGIFFVVSKTEHEPQVGEYTPDRLADLFEGTRQRELRISDEYEIFTDRTSADNFAKRQTLLHAAIKRLEAADMDQLEDIVEALADPERLVDTIHHRCE
jgi:hypothetical protein